VGISRRPIVARSAVDVSRRHPLTVARRAAAVTLQPRYGGGEKCRGCQPKAVHWGYMMPISHQPEADPYHEADFSLRLTAARSAVDVTLRLRCELPWMSAGGCPLGSPQY